MLVYIETTVFITVAYGHIQNYTREQFRSISISNLWMYFVVEKHSTVWQNHFNNGSKTVAELKYLYIKKILSSSELNHLFNHLQTLCKQNGDFL